MFVCLFEDNSKNTPGINMKICMRINVKKTNEFSVSFLKSEPQLEPLKIILYYARENAPHLGRKRCIFSRVIQINTKFANFAG